MNADYLTLANLDVILRDAFNGLKSVKPIFNNYFERLGQVSLFLNANYDLADLIPDIESDSLINSHFAKLKEDYGSKNFILMNIGKILDRSNIWEPSSCFPDVNSDVLLYLLLMGGKYHNAFQEDGFQVPYSFFLMDIQKNRNVVGLPNDSFESGVVVFFEIEDRIRKLV